ncbi:GGDEF domain-containing protein [Deinococcus aerophilus]|uniref:GGDEF domain-containing protein n=1 Tax=Deinococcus aerophilus TaxID=522488 RepID=A0ABQ2GJV5_9DEIO|nr:diguanylate cyclase [Deinococcus aerophilus]GGL98872.1 GGDEF domain-containing protein [Deinococcus aerophilus]
MNQELLLNFCLLVTLSYLLSVTYRSWTEPRCGRPMLLRLAFKAVMALILLSFPAHLQTGVIIDLRTVPVVMATLRYGPGAGLLVALPVLLYRAVLGGVGVPVAVISLLSVIVVVSVLRRRWHLAEAAGDVPRTLALAATMFAPNLLSLPLLTSSLTLFNQIYLPLLTLNLAGFFTANSIVQSRLRLLRLTASFREQAHQDQLSGLANRRQFDRDICRAGPGDLLLMIDIDHFKSVNDTYGHAEGDRVLVGVGQALQSALRQHDVAYRYGGEEFTAIVRRVSGRPQDVAERIRRHLAAQRFANLGDRGITVSVGVSACGEVTAAETVQRADEALYAAKRAGRNRVQVWASALESGSQHEEVVPADRIQRESAP